MNMTLIYKETFDDSRNRKSNAVQKVELIELDENPENAIKAAKLYQLQLPADIKDSVAFKVAQIRIS